MSTCEPVIDVPYGVAILIYKHQIVNWLCKEFKLSSREGLERWEKARTTFDKEIHTEMEKRLNEDRAFHDKKQYRSFKNAYVR